MLAMFLLALFVFGVRFQQSQNVSNCTKDSECRGLCSDVSLRQVVHVRNASVTLLCRHTLGPQLALCICRYCRRGTDQPSRAGNGSEVENHK